MTTAARHQRACLDLGLALGSEVQVAYSMITAARLVAPDDAARAVRLHAKAEQVLVDNGHRLYDEDLAASEQMLDTTRRLLGDDEFAAADGAGRAMALSEAALLAGDALDRAAQTESDQVSAALKRSRA